MTILPLYCSATGPGAALAVVVGREAPHLECYGLADLQRGIKITPDTVFELASASKTFTATGIMLLVERGCLDLTAPVGEYVPQVQKPDAGRPITARDLLWHTSGLPDYLESGMYTPMDQASPEYVIGQLPEWAQRARPGEEHSYSNTNSVVLSRVIEAISGLGFAEFIDSNLVAPIGLRDTFILDGTSDAKQIANGYRNLGYGLPLFEPSKEFILDTVGDGGMCSTLNDLVRWQSRFWNGDVVSEQSLMQMQSPGRLDSGESFEYGFGLQIEQREGRHTWCGHGGSWTNTTVLFGRYPKEQTTVIVLSNEFMAPVERISQRALSLSRESH